MWAKSVVVIDNYDSFTYNLVHIIENLLAEEVQVYFNDKVEIAKLTSYQGIILSPGPGLPSEAGNMPEIIKAFYRSHKILGVCLGHQAIGEVFGARLLNLPQVYHGVASEIIIDTSDPIFSGLPERIMVGRYHSWVVDKTSLPKDLKVLAEDKDGNIMGIRHMYWPVYGIQFHPESVLTPEGEKILKNWLEL